MPCLIRLRRSLLPHSLQPTSFFSCSSSSRSNQRDPNPSSSPSSSASAAAARRLHHLLRSRDLLPAIDFLLSSPIPLPDHAFNAVVRRLAAAGQLRRAVAVFRRIPTPSAFSYNSLLDALLRRGRTRSATRLFDEMLRDPAVRPDVCTFNTLIRGFCVNSMIGEAFRLFRDMPRRHRLDPDIVTYNTILNGLCAAGDVRTARNLLDGMKTKSPDIAPNVVSYTTVIRGYCRKLLPAEAVNLFEEMVATGIKPTRITYNTLVQGLCDARRMDLVKGVLEQADGGSGDVGFRPDTCTFNTLIAAYCKMGCTEDAMNVFDKMPEMRVKRDSATYSVLIRALCQSGDFGKAEELVDELMEKGVLMRRGVCVPLVAAYNPIFEYLCQNGKAEKARRVFRQLLDRRATMDVAAFKTLILGHCKEGALKEGYELLVSMVKRDLVPDIETYQAMIEGFLEKGKMRYAWDILDKMLGSGHQPSTSTFHSVLASLLKDKHAEEASNLVAVMVERKIRQNIDLSTDVVACLFRNGSNDRAFKTLGLLYDNGYYVKVAKLARSLSQDQKFLEAWELLRFSLSKHQKLDGDSYCMVINGLCETGRASEAFELFYEMIEKGIASAPSCLVALKLALEKTGRLKEVEFISKQMSRTELKAVNCI